jgi:hypothetical protein
MIPPLAQRARSLGPLAVALLLLMSGSAGLKSQSRQTVSGVYRVPQGSQNGQEIWIVDGALVRREIYPEFLYGGNSQRYRYVPPGEIWVDNAVSAEEFSYTVLHEIRERALMARRGMTYTDAHDSALAAERTARLADWVAARRHEQWLPRVSPTDCDGVKEIPGTEDSIRLRGVYRARLGMRDGISIWIVDGAAVRRDIFPDFGLSGNDLAYHFIPRREIWIDGKISCEENQFSIEQEISERKFMLEGLPYDDAYEKALASTRELRSNATKRASQKHPVLLTAPADRDIGTGDERTSGK